MVVSTLRFSLGCVLVAVGVAGLLLPILPGWIFLLPGLALLSTFPRVKRLIDPLKKKLVRLYRRSSRAATKDS